MLTRAVRLYGVNDLRLESFDLGPVGDDDVLCEIVCDSICMSSYKAASQGAAHKRVPADVAQNPVIIGHEFCGKIVEVGKNWRNRYRPGDGFAIQPAHFYKGSLQAPGYSYPLCGGDATYVKIPIEILLMDCLLPYRNETFFFGSLSEPMSCIIGAYHAMYHTRQGVYEHAMGIREGGNLLLLAAAGPMGLGAIDYALHGAIKPALLVVTDIDDARLKRAGAVYPPEEAKKSGVTLRYVNTSKSAQPAQELMALTGGTGYHDAICFAPVRAVVEQANAVLAFDGCLNFFAGPQDHAFTAGVNFYDVHYTGTHIMGTTGGSTDDMREAIALLSDGSINPAAMITHIGGLDSAAQATLNLPSIPGGKKLIYTHIDLPLTAIADFETLGETDELFRELGRIVASNGGLWCPEAERRLLEQKSRKNGA